MWCTEMGHDVIAGPLTDDQLHKIREALDFTVYTQEKFDNRFADCDQSNFVSLLRRGAYDPYNRVIYRALGAEHLYHGCSGNGEAVVYSREEIVDARQLLPGIVADKIPEIDTTEADALHERLVKAKSLEEFGVEDGTEFMDANVDNSDIIGADNIKAGKQVPEDPRGIEEEDGFLNDIITWMTDNNRTFVRIFFG
jgi:hypothetical protein